MAEQGDVNSVSPRTLSDLEIRIRQIIRDIRRQDFDAHRGIMREVKQLGEAAKPLAPLLREAVNHGHLFLNFDDAVELDSAMASSEFLELFLRRNGGDPLSCCQKIRLLELGRQEYEANLLDDLYQNWDKTGNSDRQYIVNALARAGTAASLPMLRDHILPRLDGLVTQRMSRLQEIREKRGPSIDYVVWGWETAADHGLLDDIRKAISKIEARLQGGPIRATPELSILSRPDIKRRGQERCETQQVEAAMESLGNREYAVAHDGPVLVTECEDAVLQAFFRQAKGEPSWIALHMNELPFTSAKQQPPRTSSERSKKANHEQRDAARTLRRIQSRYRILGPCIALPGKKGQGGYAIYAVKRPGRPC